MQETRVLSRDQEEPLELEMIIDSSILVWRIPWAEEAGGLQSMGSQRVGHDWATFTFQWKIKIYTFLCLSEGKKFSYLLVAMVVLFHIMWKVCERERLLRETVTFS